MNKEEYNSHILCWIDSIARLASQPRENSWEFWLRLYRDKLGMKVDDFLHCKPNIDIICESLFGRQVQDKETGDVCVVYLTLERCVEVYLKALKVVWDFHQLNDLFRLAVYRRQVTAHNNPTGAGDHEEIDNLFYKLVVYRFPNLDAKQLHALAGRMPERSAIQQALIALGEQRNLPLAAE
jgi:hypothetical protein